MSAEIYAPSRRTLLKLGLAGAGGLVLGVELPSRARGAELSPTSDAGFTPNAFVHIDTDGTITLISPHTEFGQGIYTSTAMMMAEELEVGLDQVRIAAAPANIKLYMDPNLYDQATGGSTSTRSDWMRLRQAAAAARIMLVGAAAVRWGVPPAECRVERGVVLHGADHRLGYGELVADAAKQPVPKDIPLKPASQFKLIGTSAKRLDTPAKVNGAAVYSIDVKVPGMRIATLAMAPVKDGKLKSIDEAAARKIAGVHDVIRTDDSVAVVGEHMWAARLGLDALNAEWDAGPNGALTSAAMVAAMDRDSQKTGVVAKKKGDAAHALDGAATKLEAIYQSPYLSHSAMEPLSCTLHIRKDGADVWVGTQVPVRSLMAVAAVTGLPPGTIKVHNHLIGGAFGRRLEPDFVAVAARLAKQVDYPLKLVWTREQDLRHDYYRPYYYDRVAAGLDEDGKLVARTHRVTGPAILARYAPPAFKDGLDGDAIECAAETPYEVPAEFVDYVRHEPAAMNTSWWRGVGPTHNLFVVESFMDELAVASHQDPVAFRRAMLQSNPRALAVLDLAAEKSNWGAQLPRGSGRGLCLQFAFGTYLCTVLEVEVQTSGEVILHRATVALDCGLTINPDTVRAQMEGGLILGLGTALYNEITIANGAIVQSNFHDYRSLRMNEAPKIEVYQIQSSELPGGVGEAGTASVAGALGNAIFAATGKRLRSLPFAKQLGSNGLSGT